MSAATATAVSQTTDHNAAHREDLPETAVPLNQRPDWLYLLRDLYEVYRRSTAGGSSKIRSHQRNVREEISRIIEKNPPIVLGAAASKPVCAHLRRALDQGKNHRTTGVIQSIESIADQLTWEYGYEKLPKHLADKFAYAEIAGPNGPVVYSDVILGLVLFAPKCIYPNHSHDGITESYYCLSGSISQNDDGVYAPGSMIFNPPGRSHRITVADREPSLLAYAWCGTREKLGGQKLSFSRPKVKS